MASRILLFCLSLLLALPALAGPPVRERPAYRRIQDNLQRGWNTWHSPSVLTQVLLPEGFALNLGFKQHYWLEERHLGEALIGRRQEGAERIRPGLHAMDGSFTSLTLHWEELAATIRTAHAGDDLVVLIEPMSPSKNRIKLVLETAMLWNRPGHLLRDGEALVARLANREIRVFTTGRHVDDPYVPTRTPYLALPLEGPLAISTGKPRTLAEVTDLVTRAEARLAEQARAKYGDLDQAWLAVTSGIAWNTIYEPKHDRVVSTVGRLWNAEYGGYCLFGWDNFFLAYMTALDSRDLAFANIIEHLHGKTDEGFIPNDNRGNDSKSFDRSQPPVGGIMVREIVKKYPERWFLEAVFDDLLGWNRWWMRKRLNEGLLSYGSHQAPNPFHEPATRSKRTAGYESGMDDSPMYIDVPFNAEKNTLELQDVGLTSLVIADCRALAEMATLLGRDAERRELLDRAQRLTRAMDALWHEETGFYLNRRTDTGEFSFRLSPTLFYPLLADVADKGRSRKILDHFYDEREFAGDWILPSIARNDPTFPKQRYWRGAIWPPLNWLTYLAFHRAGFTDSARELADKSLHMFLAQWRDKGFVSENYSAITGTGDDARLSSDRFHSWGSLFGVMALVEAGHMPAPGAPLEKVAP
ncbi:hypothetical protein SCOR_13925 [Sulfidibacter corallicola]|uniref:Mannosylglycerate hydrolase MGH1-like glycoside hydrolase domain-containing protein n=1 Tax=Sulfidibacter corallicola TaxID=2818388 RepID=A0A8A4TED1_SULCO|nr:alpha,alpha-trehalase [Sulfidibacter corallicola]QTD47584.1 hypothetical protein J3U87_18485 [Sulfidibacter corallicola]